jgi:hypothetical protein
VETGWIKQLPGKVPVRQVPMGVFWGKVDLNSPPKAVAHTTEGLSEVPNYGGSSPHFTIGQKFVSQHRPLGDMAGTLRNASGGVETNRLVRLQFELVGFSSLQPWLPDSNFQRDALSGLFELAEKELDIPRKHVWPDALEPGHIWAALDNPRRPKKFPDVPGWYFHSEIPENDHWDMGSCLISKLMEGADEPQMVPAFAMVEVQRAETGGLIADEISPFFASKAALRDWAVRPREGKEDTLRKRVWNAMVENRVQVAERKVKETEIRQE